MAELAGLAIAICIIFWAVLSALLPVYVWLINSKLRRIVELMENKVIEIDRKEVEYDD